MSQILLSVSTARTASNSEGVNPAPLCLLTDAEWQDQVSSELDLPIGSVLEREHLGEYAGQPVVREKILVQD